MELQRLCALPECRKKFKPVVEWQECCSPLHTTRLRVRRYRAKKRLGGDGGGGGKRARSRHLPFPEAKAKPIKSVKVEQPDLFQMAEVGEICATLGGAIEYQGSVPMSDKDLNRYSVKSGKKPPIPVPVVDPRSPEHAAA